METIALITDTINNDFMISFKFIDEDIVKIYSLSQLIIRNNNYFNDNLEFIYYYSTSIQIYFGLFIGESSEIDIESNIMTKFVYIATGIVLNKNILEKCFLNCFDTKMFNKIIIQLIKTNFEELPYYHKIPTLELEKYPIHREIKNSINQNITKKKKYCSFFNFIFKFSKK